MSKYTLFIQTNDNTQSDYEMNHINLSLLELNKKIKLYSSYDWIVGFQIVKQDNEQPQPFFN